MWRRLHTTRGCIHPQSIFRPSGTSRAAAHKSDRSLRRCVARVGERVVEVEALPRPRLQRKMPRAAR
jgi:hypothetical protein